MGRVATRIGTCVAGLGLALMLVGCRSPWIQCTIVNHENAPVSLVEVSYPGGTFGVQTIAAGATYRYRFHALASDAVAIDFMDSARKGHTATGPRIEQGQEGTLGIDIAPDGRVSWITALTARK